MICDETLDMLREKEKTKVDDSNESKKSDEGKIEKRMMEFSIIRENGKVIHSSESIPLNSVLVNFIGATIGNCTKNGDEFKFRLNVEVDGSINLQIHAPKNEINNSIVSKLFDSVSDENKMDSKVMDIIHIIASRFSNTNMGPNNGDSPYPKNPWGNLGI